MRKFKSIVLYVFTIIILITGVMCLKNEKCFADYAYCRDHGEDIWNAKNFLSQESPEVYEEEVPEDKEICIYKNKSGSIYAPLRRANFEEIMLLIVKKIGVTWGTFLFFGEIFSIIVAIESIFGMIKRKRFLQKVECCTRECKGNIKQQYKKDWYHKVWRKYGSCYELAYSYYEMEVEFFDLKNQVHVKGWPILRYLGKLDENKEINIKYNPENPDDFIIDTNINNNILYDYGATMFPVVVCIILTTILLAVSAYIHYNVWMIDYLNCYIK